jgi:nitrite reductase/ring-hydroxylating ferredoxin subunit
MGEQSEWHPVSLSASIEPGAAAGVRVLGREIVIWRDIGSAVHAWEDRCPHRGMKLSFGFVRDDHIDCLYHGWQYDTGGRCRYIPAHPDLEVPETIRVTPYSALERAGMIWTAFDPRSVFPLAPAEAEQAVPVRSVYLDCGREQVLDVLRPASFQPYLQSAEASPVFRSFGYNLYTLSAAEDTLLIGVQTISDRRTALHIAIAGSLEAYGGRGQAHFFRWANALRHRIESNSLDGLSNPSLLTGSAL